MASARSDNTAKRRISLFIGMAIGTILFCAVWPGSTASEAARTIYWIGITLGTDWFLERRTA